ncbi:hypothetical protein SAMN04487866_10816 [Thermoactinomyces sp. DSM 45891]|uniref:hypothetical protein n=1 Tax=Thermoactinomyces sp. DSM 45891 TaxID=1761907 RepID=UPI00091F541C|nr:hypothetical protein [Thermoactinomyces sp. DSM 45891]SFX44336.1 hypothetical protein SAMN04487866_10816 [Thermoactinomyces sp. DSM 45891]
MLKKKFLAVTLSMGLLAGGVFVSNQKAFADEPNTKMGEQKGHEKKEKVSKEQRIEQISGKVSTYLGVPKAEVQKLAQDSKIGVKNVVFGAVIAKKTNQTLAQAIAEKEKLGHWKQVMTAHKLEWKDIHPEMKKIAPHFGKKLGLIKNPTMMYKVLSTYTGESTSTLKGLNEKYNVHPKGLINASVLSKASGKKLEDVLKLKTSDNKWKDVATKLNVDKQKLVDAKKELFTKLRAEKKEQKLEPEQKQNQGSNQ